MKDITEVKRDMADLLRFMEFISSFEVYGDFKKLFESLDEFLQEKLNAGPLFVISRPKDQAQFKGKVGYKRNIWNKKKYPSMAKILDPLFASIPVTNEQEYIRYFPDEGQVLFYCGEMTRQRYFGSFSIDRVPSPYVLEFLVKFMNSISKAYHHFRDLEKKQFLIYIDDITGLYNQRKLLLDLDKSIELYNEKKEEFVVLFIDIDHIKNVNDGHGHLVGTHLLLEVAKLFKSVLRETDYLYRYGGDEFVVILPDVSMSIGQEVGERLLEIVKRTPFDIRDIEGVEVKKGERKKLNLTISIGVANFPQNATSKDEILNIADRMMYHAKERGRGRVCMASEI